MLVIADSHIPYLKGVLEPLAEVHYLEPQDITAENVRNAEVLFPRTRTRCDAQLLEGSQVKLILTATIGFDHIDTAYCEEKGIEWHNCPGCNAQGVCDYVESALLETGMLNGGKTIGIVGAGHVGSLVEEMAMRHGMDVVLCDPLRAEHEHESASGNVFTSMEAVAAVADVITFHTPLTDEGNYPTRHLCDAAFLQSCKPEALIINTARGGIVDEEALCRTEHPFVIDCWEDEPHIHQETLTRARLASMHIAGYTRLGKYRATEMAVEAFNRFFHTDAKLLERNTFPESKIFSIEEISKKLKAKPEQFEQLRESYKLR